mmetsp:Transcript_2343/g.3749  ORF Transcript_2343/g.3749 Transcript_2343/m.3749 type:complete len:400 (+) Transcript_2343:42-1241(+)
MEVLTVETVGAYVAERMEKKVDKVEEIVGGNLNYAWRIYFEDGESIFVKQAPGYIKCLGPEFSLTSARMSREFEALSKCGELSEKHVPKILKFDKERCTVMMEDLFGFRLLREDLLDGKIEIGIGKELAFLIKKLRLCESFDCGGKNNQAMCAITRDYIFTKPFINDETNRQLKDQRLVRRAVAFRGDAQVLGAILKAREAFDKKRECFCHGDLHCGSIMTDGTRAVAIDWEFAFFGPSSFDIALLLAGYCFIYFTAHVWSPDANNAALRRRQVKLTLAALLQETEQDPIPHDLPLFAACELSRRILGAASVPELSNIKDEQMRASIEIALLDLSTTFLVKPPSSPIALLAILDDTYDASLFFAIGERREKKQEENSTSKTNQDDEPTSSTGTTTAPSS